MKDVVFQALAGPPRLKEPVALGIITRVKGSSPQKTGAKALFHRDGRISGTLGGGCLEAELQRRAIHSLRTGKPETFELLLDHDFGWDDGLICGGTVMGLLLPNVQEAGAQFWKQLAERKTALVWRVKEDFSVAAIPQSQSLGPEAARLQQAACGRIVPGGDDQSPPLQPAFTQASQIGSSPRVADVAAGRAPTEAQAGWRYQEYITPSCALWIAGAGHIAQAVAPLAWQLDFDVTVFDDRPALVSHHIFPHQIGLQSDTWEKLLASPFPQVPAFGLIVTRGHRHDALVLQHWIHRPFVFLGMIGSARKARTTFEHFVEEKLATAEELRRVACPVGLPIQSRTVMEIAVSIMAQFIAKRAELVQPSASLSIEAV
jgi:xanthine dehydrogenase accessory factor